MIRRHHTTTCTQLVVLAVVLASGWLASPAGADTTFCPSVGSAAGQCAAPEGVAVDTETGRVYVADRSNHRIDVFGADGSFVMAFGWGVADGVTPALQTCTTTCFKGLAGAGAGQFNEPRSIAVDNEVGSTSRHSVYVFDGKNRRVEKFGPAGNFLLSFGEPGSGPGQFGSQENKVRVGPGSAVYVGDTQGSGIRVEKFEANGSFIEAVSLEGVGELLGDLAVDPAGDLYATVNLGGGIYKFHPDGSKFGAPYPLESGIFSRALAVDATGNLYAAQGEGKVGSPGLAYRPIGVYGPSGTLTGRFGYQIVKQVQGLAFNPTAFGDLYASEERLQATYLSLPAPGPLAPGQGTQATAVTNTRATLNAEVNPEGKATDYRFEYLPQASFEAEGGFAGPQLRSTPAQALDIPAGKEFNLRLAQALAGCPDPVSEAESGACLEPATDYRFRVLATNADGSAESQGAFTTKPPLAIEDAYATEAGADTIRLNALVDPLGLPASGRFQYVEEQDFQESGFADATLVPAEGQAPLSFGSGEGAVLRSIALSPLEEGTDYRYRLLASNPLIDQPLTSEALSFRTFRKPAPQQCPANAAFRAGPSAFLPDCRAYELVSPLEKNNGDVLALEAGGPYKAVAQLNQGSPDGERLTYSASQAFAGALAAPYTSQYLATRGPEGWRSEALAPPMGSAVLEFLGTFDTPFKAFSADLCRAWVRTIYEPALAPGAVAGFPNLYRRENCGSKAGAYAALTTAIPTHKTTERPFPGEHYSSLEWQGSSADGSHAVFAVRESFAGAAAQPLACASDLNGYTSCQLRLYERVDGKALRSVCVLPGGAPFSGGCSAGEAHDVGGIAYDGAFNNAISADGERVFWTAAGGNGAGPGPIYARVGGASTVAASAEAEGEKGSSASSYKTAADDGSRVLFTTGGALYEFRLAGESTHRIADGVIGFMGASEDATRSYFASTEALAPGAVAGERNLYFHEGGSFRFIAALSADDAKNATVGGGVFSALNGEPLKRSARVSPDGLHAAFLSNASLTGYDNRDAANGRALGEVYLYDAAEQKLLCASCNPSGARPVGQNLSNSVNQYWAAAQLPGAQNATYFSRVLAEDGARLFFESSDALSPADTNGRQDVYQWEEVGKGGCSAASPGYAPSAQGCVDLVSSGKSARKSQVLDADASGNNVFFSTLASLVPQDYGLVDIYDARAGGGLPPPPALPAECEGESCQAPAPAPRQGTPASLAYEGPGNLARPGAKPRRCAKGRRAVKSKRGTVRCVKRKRAGAARGTGR